MVNFLCKVYVCGGGGKGGITNMGWVCFGTDGDSALSETSTRRGE